MARAEFNMAAHRCGDILTGEHDGHFQGRPDPAADRIIEIYRDYHDAVRFPKVRRTRRMASLYPLKRSFLYRAASVRKGF